ncbi:MAG: FHA domain-containing protein [Halioglobus sp.]|nr:FHA domain-containing protein [Halioglobus sp.]
MSIEYGGGSLVRELKRRKVLRAGVLYVVICAIALLLVSLVLPAVGIDGDGVWQLLLVLALLGLPAVLILAWYLQLTPRGVARTTSFVERRVLRNMAPINDQRHAGAPGPVQQGAAEEDFNWVICAETGPLTGLRFGIDRPVELGRSLDCDIAIVSPHVSPRHARLELRDGELVVEDLGSDRGTVVNGRRVAGSCVLGHEDELRLHDVVFRVTENRDSAA